MDLVVPRDIPIELSGYLSRYQVLVVLSLSQLKTRSQLVSHGSWLYVRRTFPYRSYSTYRKEEITALYSPLLTISTLLGKIFLLLCVMRFLYFVNLIEW